jgi:hypothetical protein
VEGVLNLGVQPAVLIEKAKQRLLDNGGACGFGVVGLGHSNPLPPCARTLPTTARIQGSSATVRRGRS